MNIADNAIFGYGVKVSSHVISPSREHGGLGLRQDCPC